MVKPTMNRLIRTIWQRKAPFGEVCVQKRKPFGFTLIELLVVMAVIALLLSIAAPRYFSHIERAKENTLRQSLAVMRDAIDKYEADRNKLPESLDDLVHLHYLRAVPKDPFTNSSETWQLESPPDNSDSSGVYDIHSGAEGQAQDGIPLGEL
jgi:general secretion pathway protein G